MNVEGYLLGSQGTMRFAIHTYIVCKYMFIYIFKTKEFSELTVGIRAKDGACCSWNHNKSRIKKAEYRSV